MSGFLGLAASLATSSGGVTLGGIQLSGMEVPERMPWGGTQKLAIHELPGGGRVIDAIGAYDRDIEWSGTFLGGSAVSRARAVDAMRVAGVPVALVWSDFRRRVVIKSFEPDYTRRGTLVAYRISCVVLPVVAPASAPTLTSSVGSDLSAASGVSGLASTATAAIVRAQSLIPVASVLTGGSVQAVALVSAVSGAGGVLSGLQSSAGSALASITAAAPSGALFGGAGGILGASAAQDTLAAATGAAAYVGRAAKKLLSL